MKYKVKPRKRMIFYLFFERGYLFILITAFLWMNYLYYFTNLVLTARIVFYSIPLLAVFGLLMCVYEWLSTDYYILNDYVFLKDLSGLEKIRYKDIKKVYTSAPVLQLLMGTTNVCLKTDKNTHYIRGVRNFHNIESRIISSMHKEF